MHFFAQSRVDGNVGAPLQASARRWPGVTDWLSRMRCWNGCCRAWCGSGSGPGHRGGRRGATRYGVAAWAAGRIAGPSWRVPRRVATMAVGNQLVEFTVSWRAGRWLVLRQGYTKLNVNASAVCPAAAVSPYNLRMKKCILRSVAMVLASLLLLLSTGWGALALWFSCPAARRCVGRRWPCGRQAAWRRWSAGGALGARCCPGCWRSLCCWRGGPPLRQRGNGAGRRRPYAWSAARSTAASSRSTRCVISTGAARRFPQRWEQRRYDLDRLRSVDWRCPIGWGRPSPTLVSFGFDDGRYITFPSRSARSAASFSAWPAFSTLRDGAGGGRRARSCACAPTCAARTCTCTA